MGVVATGIGGGVDAAGITGGNGRSALICCGLAVGGGAAGFLKVDRPETDGLGIVSFIVSLGATTGGIVEGAGFTSPMGIVSLF
jgi:hypothetical protein